MDAGSLCSGALKFRVLSKHEGKARLRSQLSPVRQVLNLKFENCAKAALAFAGGSTDSSQSQEGSVDLDLFLALALGRDPVLLVRFEESCPAGSGRGNYWGVWKLKE